MYEIKTKPLNPWMMDATKYKVKLNTTTLHQVDIQRMETHERLNEEKDGGECLIEYDDLAMQEHAQMHIHLKHTLVGEYLYADPFYKGEDIFQHCEGGFKFSTRDPLSIALHQNKVNFLAVPKAIDTAYSEEVDLQKDERISVSAECANHGGDRGDLMVK